MPTKRKRVTIKLSAEIHDTLKRLSLESGVSMSDFVRLAIHKIGRRVTHGRRRTHGTKRGSK